MSISVRCNRRFVFSSTVALIAAEVFSVCNSDQRFRPISSDWQAGRPISVFTHPFPFKGKAEQSRHDLERFSNTISVRLDVVLKWEEILFFLVNVCANTISE